MAELEAVLARIDADPDRAVERLFQVLRIKTDPAFDPDMRACAELHAADLVQAALTDEWGREAAFIGMGGSIPVATLINERLGIDPVMVGFGLNDDRIHSPNEKYDLRRFRKGIRSWVLAVL